MYKYHINKSIINYKIFYIAKHYPLSFIYIYLEWVVYKVKSFKLFIESFILIYLIIN